MIHIINNIKNMIIDILLRSNTVNVYNSSEVCVKKLNGTIRFLSTLTDKETLLNDSIT